MTYKAHIKNGAIVLDEPMHLPEGTVLQIQPVEPAVTLGDLLQDVAGKGKNLPADGSSQHDHYIYGTSKR